MNLQQVASSPLAMRLGMVLSRIASPRVGHSFSWRMAGWVCRARPAVHKTVQANLARVLGPGTAQETLDRTTREVYYSTLRSWYDLFRARQLPHQELVASVDYSEVTRAVAQDLQSSSRGTVLVIPHLSNFDLGGHVLAAYVARIQVLTLPNPPPGFRLANELRRNSGIEITPLAPAALRQALQRLKAGGVVGTAGDRPVSDLDDPVPFFGQPARVPSGHVRLALKANARVVVAYCVLSPNTDKYTLCLEPPLELVRTGDRDEDVRINMRFVLDKLEAVIRRWPGQWQMFVPVWPGLLTGERSISP
jgi:phosphatidylinositol dimannoside acyltransferase